MVFWTRALIFVSNAGHTRDSVLHPLQIIVCADDQGIVMATEHFCGFATLPERLVIASNVCSYASCEVENILESSASTAVETPALNVYQGHKQEEICPQDHRDGPVYAIAE